MKRFGEKLRALRQQHGLTLTQPDEMCGVYNSYVSPIAGQLAWSRHISPQQQKLAGVVGALLLFLGMLLYVVSGSLPAPPLSTLAVVAADTPTASPISPTLTPALSSSSSTSEPTTADTPALPPELPRPEASTATPAEAEAKEWEAEVSTRVAALRTGPDAACAVLALLTTGDRVKVSVVTEDKSWAQVRAVKTGQLGWLQVEQLNLNVSLDILPVIENR